MAITVGSAYIYPDGKVLRLEFDVSPTLSKNSYGNFDWLAGYDAGANITINGGTYPLSFAGCSYITDMTAEQQVNVNLRKLVTYWFLYGENNVIPHNASSLTINGSAGLLQDSFGNSTPSFSNLSITNKSVVDSTGFLTNSAFSRGGGGQSFYVSYTYGDDANTSTQAQSSATPWKTIEHAISEMFSGSFHTKGSALLLLEGDTWPSVPNISLRYWQNPSLKTGFLMSTYHVNYGQPGSWQNTRPTLEFSGDSFYSSREGPKNVIFNGLRFSGGNSHMFFLGFTGLGDILVTNCVFEDCGDGPTIQCQENEDDPDYGVEFSGEGVYFFRNIFKNIGIGAWRPHGLFIYNMKDIYVSQNVFSRVSVTQVDYNFTPPRDLTDIYSQNIYITATEREQGPACVWGNFFHKGGNTGVQARSGGCIFENMFVNMYEPGLISKACGRISRNVCLEGVPLYRSDGNIQQPAYTFQIRKTESPIGERDQPYDNEPAIIEFNLLANYTGTNGGVYGLMSNSSSDTPTIMHQLFRNNTLVNSGGLWTAGSSGSTMRPKQVRRNRNFVDVRLADSSGWFPYLCVNEATLPSYSFLSSSEDYYVANTNSIFGINENGFNLSTYRALLTNNALETSTIITTSASYTNSSFTIRSWYTLVTGLTPADGNQTVADYLSGRTYKTWNATYFVPSINQYFFDRLLPINLPSVGSGSLNFYGAPKSDVAIYSATDTIPPAVPSQLTTSSIEYGIRITWEGNDDADFLRNEIHVSDSSGSGFAFLDYTSEKTYDHENLTAGAKKYYKVRAEDTNGNLSNFSNEVNGTAGADITPPAIPTGLAATPGVQSVSLNWDDNSEPDLSLYTVRYGVVNGGSYLLQVSSTVSNATIGNLAPGTTYYFVVSARDSSNNSSGNSSQVSAIPTAPVDTTPPAAPTGLIGIAGVQSATLNWNDNVEGDFSFYSLKYGTTSGVYADKISVVPSVSQITNLIGEQTYYFAVSAFDSSGNESVNSSEISVTPTSPPNTSVPSAPTGVSITGGDDYISLSWDENSPSEGVIDYAVEISTTSSSTGFGDIRTTSNANIDITGLSDNIIYWFRIKARNANGYSSYSEVVSGSPTTSVAPSELSESIGSSLAKAVAGPDRALTIGSWTRISGLNSLPISGSRITKYKWYKNGRFYSTRHTFNYQVEDNNTVFRLVIICSDGTTASDTVNITGFKSKLPPA